MSKLILKGEFIPGVYLLKVIQSWGYIHEGGGGGGYSTAGSFLWIMVTFWEGLAVLN